MSNARIVAEILANDKASPVIAEVVKKAIAAQREVGKVAAQAAIEAREANKQMLAIQSAHANAIEKSNAGLRSMVSTMRTLAAFKLGETAFKGLKEAGALSDAAQRARNAGMSKPDVDALQLQSATVAANVPGMLRSEIVKSASELRSAVLNPREVPALLQGLVAGQAALKQTGHGEAAEQMVQFVKGAEQLNLTKNAEVFQAATNNFVKSVQFFNGLLTPETWRKSVAAAGVSGGGWSEHFREMVFPSLVAEQGERAGTGLNAINKLVTSGFNNNKAALKEWTRLGLVAVTDIDEKKGQIALKAGAHVKDYQKAITDPDAFVRDTILPAMIAKGIVAPAEQLAEIRRLFPNGTASQEVYKLANQTDLLRKDEAGIKSAVGTAAAYRTDSAPVALGWLDTAATNFVSTLTSPGMKDAAHGMSWLSVEIADFTNRLAKLQKNHPVVAEAVAATALVGGGAAAVGGLTAIINKLSGASAIKASALALDGSAVALDRAAIALTAAAEAKGALGAVGGKAGRLVGEAEAAVEGGAVAGGAGYAGRGAIGAGVDVAAREAGPLYIGYKMLEFLQPYLKQQNEIAARDRKIMENIRPQTPAWDGKDPQRLNQAYAREHDLHPVIEGLRDMEAFHGRGLSTLNAAPPAPLSGTVNGELSITQHMTLDASGVIESFKTYVAGLRGTVNQGPTMTGANSPHNPTPMATAGIGHN